MEKHRTGEPCDAVVVLGTRVLADGRPSPALARRVDHAVRLFHEGRARHLVMSGGLGDHPPAEAQVMRDHAVRAGVPPERILMEAESDTTFENALRSAAILRARGWSRLIVVSQGYHLPRALFLFRRLGFEAAGSAAPGAGYFGAARATLGLRVAVRLREVAAWPWYLWRIYVRDRRRVASARIRS